MAVAAVATVAFLAFAGLAWAATLDQARDHARLEVRKAGESDAEREQRLQHTAVRFDSVQYQNGPKRATLTLTNTGQANLDAASVDVLLDGVWRTGDVTSRRVDNAESRVWSPQTQLVLVVQNVQADPFRHTVVTGEGFVAIAEG
ncbi:MAG TPA: hypothetical protein VFH47_06420 [Candidatus Thermoplasmatota archaeon]|nr:hypothetical protein [Candidatus Thermoplasmatota archaeon]